MTGVVTWLMLLAISSHKYPCRVLCKSCILVNIHYMDSHMSVYRGNIVAPCRITENDRDDRNETKSSFPGGDMTSCGKAHMVPGIYKCILSCGCCWTSIILGMLIGISYLAMVIGGENMTSLLVISLFIISILACLLVNSVLFWIYLIIRELVSHVPNSSKLKEQLIDNWPVIV